MKRYHTRTMSTLTHIVKWRNFQSSTFGQNQTKQTPDGKIHPLSPTEWNIFHQLNIIPLTKCKAAKRPLVSFLWLICIYTWTVLKGHSTSSHQGDSYSYLPLSLPSRRLNLFRLTHSAKCQNTPMAPFFIFLDWRLCTLLNLCVCELSRHKWGRPHLRTARPPKVPLTEKCYALYWNHRGNVKSRVIFWRSLPLPPWQEISPFFYRWLHIWKLQLQENVGPEKQMYEYCVACGSPHYPHLSRGACLLRPLILGCFRGHVSLLVHHSLVFHAISPIHTLRLTGTERDRLVVMGLSRPSVRSR